MINKKILATLFLLSSAFCQASRPQNDELFFNPERKNLQTQEIVQPSMIVVNYTTESTLQESIEALKRARVSTHYIIDKDGTAFETMHAIPKPTTTIDPEYLSKRAWHAGHASWDGKSDVNSYSIGALFVNEGATPKDNPNVLTNDPSNKTVFYDYSPQQISTAVTLFQQLKDTYNIADKDIIGHGDVAINPTTKSLGRKIGPGPKFPWKELAQQGVGLFHNKSEQDLALSCNFSILDLQKALKIYGYSVQETGIEDEQTKQAVLEFQIHHDPQHINGDAKSCRNMLIINNLIAQHVLKHVDPQFRKSQK